MGNRDLEEKEHHIETSVWDIQVLVASSPKGDI
jgi:hypothetical protein